MTDGWVLAIFIVVLGLLVLIGIVNNASISHDGEKRHRRGRSPARPVMPETVAELAKIEEQADPRRRRWRCIDRRRRVVAAIDRSVIAIGGSGGAPMMAADITPLVRGGLAAATLVMPPILGGDRAGDDAADGKGEDQARSCRLNSCSAAHGVPPRLAGVLRC
jgi:hypothetical protein